MQEILSEPILIFTGIIFNDQALKHILFLSKYSADGASSRYRTYQFLRHFEDKGYKCTVKPFFGAVHIERINNNKRGFYPGLILAVVRRILLLFSVRKYDLVFIEKEIIPYFPSFPEYLLHLFHKKYVLDFDDAVFHNYDQSKRKIIRVLFGKKIPRILKHAAHVICGSQYLLNYCVRHNPEASLIPTVIEKEKYSFSLQDRPDFIIGWIGSFYTGKSLMIILPALKAFCEKHTCKIKLIGVNESVFNNFGGLPAEKIRWTAENERLELTTFDVGLAPLDDTAFNRGKCAFKIVQYMACGSTVICSPVGANAETVIHGTTGFHAAGLHDWEKYLEKLYMNREELLRLKANSRKRFEELYSLENVLPEYLRIFDKICKK
jgi:glycosyltransferase involved in cell wall biosynthesis